MTIELPPKNHSKGLIDIQPNLPNPGDYHVIVAIGEEAPEDNTMEVFDSAAIGISS